MACDSCMTAIEDGFSNKVSLGSFACAAMVIAIHVGGGAAPHGSFVWWWEQIGHWGAFLMAVPFFFVCSGYFLARHSFERGWWSRECLKRIRTLGIPFLIWNIVYVGLNVGVILFANVMHGREMLANMPSGLGYWARAVGIHPYEYPLLVPLWYVRSLIIFVIISPIVVRLVKKFGAKFLLVMYLCAWICSMLAAGKVAAFLGKTFSVSGMLYFSTGVWVALARKNTVDVSFLNKRHAWALLVFGFLLICACAVCAFGLDCRSPRWARLVFVPFLLIGFWGVLPERKFSGCFPGLAFQIYLLHVPVMFVGGLFLSWCTKSMLGWWMKYAFALVGSFVCCFALKRVFPRIAAVAFGGRL